MSGFPWRTALFVSIALNLVIVSAGIGALASGARLERPSADVQGAPRVPGARAFMRNLPPHARRQLRLDLAASVREIAPERRASRQARRALYAAMAAEPYERDRVRAALGELRAADARVAARFDDALAEAAGNLDPADRRAALAAMRADIVAPPAP